MTKQKNNWHLGWFNKDYLNLYSYRNELEAVSHVDFIIDNLPNKQKYKVLDMGCGSGRHSVLFADHAFHVIGIDTSEILINEAKKLENSKRDLKFYCQDMRNLRGFDKFDLIVNMFTSFGYFESDQENQSVINAVAYALESNGVFFLDFLSPKHVISNLTPSENLVVNGEKVSITRSIDENIVTKIIDFPGRSYTEHVKLYDRNTIEKMLQSAGLIVLKAWSDYNGTPWSEYGSRQLFLIGHHQNRS